MGLRDSNISQTTNLSRININLDKAITMARRTEAVREGSGKGRDRQHLHKNRGSRAQLLQRKKLQTVFQVSKIPKQPTSKVALDVASSFQNIQVPGL